MGLNIFLLNSTTLENRGFVIIFTWEKLDIPFPFEDLLCNWHYRSTEESCKNKKEPFEILLNIDYPNILYYWPYMNIFWN